jgi:hypothetical protein
MWCPSATLSVWANAWLAGSAAPDDVLDALSRWAPRQSVAAYDAVAAGHAGLPWPDVDDAGTLTLLPTLRSAAGSRSSREPAISIVLPVPGDVRGLAPGTQFERDALAAGEAVIVAGEHGTAVGLVPEFMYEEPESGEPDTALEICALSWTVYSLPGAPVSPPLDLGEAEYTLRAAVRSAAETLGTMRAGYYGNDVPDPRGLVEQVLETDRQHSAPDDAPSRALRVLENAAHVDAIMTVSSGLMPIGTHSSEAQIANEALRPLSAVVRSARMAAVTAILHEAWR